MIVYEPVQKIFTSSLIKKDNILFGFGTKSLGFGQKHIVNILNHFSTNKININRLIIPEQIHSTNIEVIEPRGVEKILKIEDTDGLITNEPGTVLAVVTADCCPIIYCDENKELIGISHQGWRGSIKKMVQKMIVKMIDMGSRVADIKVVIGPCVGSCCYDIDEDRYYSFMEEFDRYSKEIVQRVAGRWFLNLTKLNYLLLVEKGVKKENVDFFPFCTKCDSERFFSFRRDHDLSKGEMFSFIMKVK